MTLKINQLICICVFKKIIFLEGKSFLKILEININKVFQF